MSSAGFSPTHHWQITTLGAVTQDRVDQSGPSSASFSYIDISGIDNERKTVIAAKSLSQDGAPTRARQRVSKDDVLVSMTRPNLNAVAVVPPELDGAIASTGFHVLRASDNVTAKWLLYFVQTGDFVNRMSGLVQGALYPAVRPKDIRACPLPLPPTDQQDRIVAEIEKQFTRLDAAKEAIGNARRKLSHYRRSLLNATFSGRLMASPSAEWRSVAMNELVADAKKESIFAGPFGTIFKARDFRPAGVPIIFLRHIAPGRYLTRRPGFMDKTKWMELFQPYSVFGGELLITKLGEPPGTCAIYPENIGPAMVTPDVIAMKVNEGLAVPHFLMHYLNSDVARRLAFGMAFGTTRLRLTLPLFRKIAVKLPPLEEQHRLVSEVERRLSIIESVEATLIANEERSDRLRNRLLASAFAGRLIGDGVQSGDIGNKTVRGHG